MKHTSLSVLENLVYDFKDAMFEKLKRTHAEGRRGWDSDDWTEEDIEENIKSQLLCDPVDPIDIANYAMFLWNRRVK